VAALLVSEELTELGESEEVERITRRLHERGTNWDATAARETGDYFAQERTTIRDQFRLGAISTLESDRMSDLIERVQETATSSPTTAWQPAEFRKDLVGAADAVGEARAALAVMASGLPTAWMRSADELIAALFQDVTRPSPDGGPHEAVEAAVLRLLRSHPSRAWPEAA